MGLQTDLERFSPTRAPTVDWGWGDAAAHTVQFYEDDGFLLAELSRFIGSALGAGHAGVVFATRAHREGLAARLAARGLDVDLALRQGRFVSLDAAETLARCTVDGWPDAALFAEVVGGIVARAAAAAEHPRVAVFGEIVALLCAEGKQAHAIRLEELWNDLAKTHDFHLHCAYPLGAFARADDGESFARVCAEHARVIPAEGYAALTTDEDRLRAISYLQQKAQALDTEIGERKQLEQTLRDRNRDLSAAVAARDDFLSVAAHELKTPVTSLRAYAQLLLRDLRRREAVAQDRLDAAVQAVESQTGKLGHLLTRLLDTAQIESGRLRLEPSRTDLVALVRAAIAQHEGGVHPISFDGPDHLAAEVDAGRFEQVVGNLLDNAVKFSPDGGEVTVNLRAEPDGGIRLCVTDHGVGIPPDQREAIFDRFHQGRNGGHLSGMGLGLFIAREIVALHGGQLRVEEPEHPGSRFVVTLPPAA